MVSFGGGALYLTSYMCACQIKPWDMSTLPYRLCRHNVYIIIYSYAHCPSLLTWCINGTTPDLPDVGSKVGFDLRPEQRPELGQKRNEPAEGEESRSTTQCAPPTHALRHGHDTVV